MKLYTCGQHGYEAALNVLHAGICKTLRMTIAKQHISAVSLSGPYWADINFSPLLAIPHVRRLPSGIACGPAPAWLLSSLTN